MYRIIMAIFVLVCFQAALVGTAFAGPRIVFTEEEYNFGPLVKGENREHFFTFKNAGDEPLKIERIKTSCGCTASSIAKDLIAPAEDGEIKVVYKTQNRLGSFQQKIRVFSNDPDNPETVLTVRGEIKSGPAPAIEVKKPHVDLGVFHMRNRVSFTLLVENTGDEQLEIYSIADYRGVVLFEGALSILPEETKPMDLYYKAQKPGIIKETMFITSSDPRKPRLPIYLSGYVQDKDIIIITREHDTTFSLQNNMAVTILVTTDKTDRHKQAIDPGKRFELQAISDKSTAPVVFSIELTGKE